MKIGKTKAILLTSLLTLLLPLALAQLATAQQTSTSSETTSVPTLTVDPSTYTVTHSGEVFTININIVNASDLAEFEFKLGYNTTFLDAIEAVEGPFPPGKISPYPLVEINETGGYVWVYAICLPAEGNGTLATITFKATYAGSIGTVYLYTLHLYDVWLGDSVGNKINPMNTSDGTVALIVSIPEFPVAVVIPLLLTATLTAAFLGKMVWSRKRRGPSVYGVH